MIIAIGVLLLAAFLSGLVGVALLVRARLADTRSRAVLPLAGLAAALYAVAFVLTSVESRDPDAAGEPETCKNAQAETRRIATSPGRLFCVYRAGASADAPTLGCSLSRADADALCTRVADIVRAHPTAPAQALDAAFTGAARDLNLSNLGQPMP